MGKRLLMVITVLLIAGLAAGWYFFARESRYFGTSPLKAVPVEAPFFVRVRNLGDFAAKTVKNKSWQSLQGIPQISSLYSDFVFIDSLILQNKDRGSFLLQKEIIFVPGDSSKLYLMEIGSISEKNSIQSIIRNYFQSKRITPTESKFKEANVQQFKWTENGELKRILVTFYKGMLMIGNDSSGLRRAVNQTENSSVLDDTAFMRVNKISTENSDLNIYFNHKTLPVRLSHYYAGTASSGIFQPDYAKWTEVDVEQKENQLLINGFSVADTTRSFYTDIYRHQIPVEGSIIRLMPLVTSYFMVQNLSNPVQYLEDLKIYLGKNGKSEQYEEQLAGLSKELNVDIRKYLLNRWTGEAAAVFTGFNLENSADNRFLLMKVREAMNDPMIEALKQKATANRNSRNDPESSDAAKDNIWEMPCKNFGSLLGEPSFGSIETKWITQGEDYILMGATPGSLKRYVNFLRMHELLQEKSTYQKFTSGLARTSNFYIWFSPGQTLSFFEKVFRHNPWLNLQKISPDLAKVENIAWQFGHERGMIYNTASLNVNPSAEKNLVPFWSCPLKAKMRNKPVLVSYSDKNTFKELVFQDMEDNLVDIDKDGIERWKIRLEGPILGKIKMIDYKKNGEFQLLFNTRDAIHLINSRGAEMRNYPIRLKSGATNEMSVFDYEGKKDYRYLLACRDRKVYNFDQYGKMIPGWQAKVTQNYVEQPVRYFKVGSREYIVYFEQNRTYILDRQGKERVRLSDNFVHSKNDLSLVSDSGGTPFMVTTDDRGNIRLIGFDGSVKKTGAGNFSGSHNFLPVSINGSGFSDFLFLDKQTISLYDFKGRLINSYPVKGLPDEPVALSADINNGLIEIYLIASNRAILLKKDGSIFDANLPKGYTLLMIGSFDDKTGVSNILAYSPDGILSNFQMIRK